MFQIRQVQAWIACGLASAIIAGGALWSSSGSAETYPGGGYEGEVESLTPEERAGREIWYKATGGNGRFHTYSFAQRVIGSSILWNRFLRSDERHVRWNNWGFINDPECCTPGTEGCPAKSLDETFGFDWCPGDDDLLKYVGKQGYRDPACDFVDPDDRTDRESPCGLAFGTSAGAVGFRKFPNPRFDARAWEGWKSMEERPDDASIEPPFHVGVACASCHVSFNPSNPPLDPNRPRYENLLGTAGNQWIKNSYILGSGKSRAALEWQLFVHEKHGAVDTSAVATDSVRNPGSINAVINFSKRPSAVESILAWRKVPSCPSGSDEKQCWCDPAHAGKCWEKSLKDERISHFLKGGEDSVVHEATVQRVYLNIGSCAEECFLNHLTDLRERDSTQRNYDQTPFDIGQCRRDCASFRAIEDRAPLVLQFLSQAKTFDLAKARNLTDAQLASDLESRYGPGSLERGRRVFARECATCHSSRPGPYENMDFKELDANGIRQDWLGNDVRTPVSVVGTDACRSRHRNHLKGRVWEEFASETYRELGLGHYRNVSLINVWATAPFMHNNAVGPEVCAIPSKPEYDLDLPAYVDRDGKLLPASRQPACWKFDTTVEGRFRLYEASMDQLLNPEKRGFKLPISDQPIRLELFPLLRLNRDEPLGSFAIEIPKGTNITKLGSFRQKEFGDDLIKFFENPFGFRKYARGKFGKAVGDQLNKHFFASVFHVLFSDKKLVKIDPKRWDFYMSVYTNCEAGYENQGHLFGSDLSSQEKLDLTAFMATL